MRFDADTLLGRVFETLVYVSPTVARPLRFTVSEIDGETVKLWSHESRKPEPLPFAAFCLGIQDGRFWEVGVPPYSSMLTAELAPYRLERRYS